MNIRKEGGTGYSKLTKASAQPDANGVYNIEAEAEVMEPVPAPMVPPENATAETTNNQVKNIQNSIVINVNQRDAKYVEQTIRNAIYESQK